MTHHPGSPEHISKQKLKNLTPPLKARFANYFISQLTSALDGRKLGEDIGSLYERLKQAGMPENLIAETVKEYTRKRLESSPSLPEIVEMLMNRFLSMNIRGIKGEQTGKREKDSDKE